MKTENRQLHIPYDMIFMLGGLQAARLCIYIPAPGC